MRYAMTCGKSCADRPSLALLYLLDCFVFLRKMASVLVTTGEVVSKSARCTGRIRK